MHNFILHRFGSQIFPIVAFGTGACNFVAVLVFGKWQGQGISREGMRDGFVDGQLEDDLVADEADEVVLGIGRAHFGDQTVGIIGADDKTNDGAGITKDGFLNFFR